MEAGASLTLAYETNSTGVPGYADVQCYNSSNAIILDGGQIAGAVNAAWGDRATRPATITTPAGTTYVKVRLVAITTATTDRVRIRRVKLEKGSVWTPYSAEASAALTFTSPVFQHRFAFDLRGLSHQASDNYFELYPDEPKTVVVEFSRPVTVARLKAALTFRSLANTY